MDARARPSAAPSMTSEVNSIYPPLGFSVPLCLCGDLLRPRPCRDSAVADGDLVEIGFPFLQLAVGGGHRPATSPKTPLVMPAKAGVHDLRCQKKGVDARARPSAVPSMTTEWNSGRQPPPSSYASV